MTATTVKPKGPPPVPVAPASPRRSVNTRRLLGSPLGKPILGIQIGADVYAENGLRLLGLSAFATHEQVSEITGRLRALAKVSPAAARRLGVQTGYEEHAEADDMIEAVAQLEDPRRRVLCELFWPHISPQLMARVKASGLHACADVTDALAKVAAKRNGRDSALAAHALSIIYHNRALAQELPYLAGTGQRANEPWEQALAYWAATLEADAFWAYLEERVDYYDDPRVRPGDVAQIRQKLPAMLLEFHAIFARHYGQVGDHTSCNRHLLLIGKSSLPGDATNVALVASVKDLTSRRLEPAIRRAQQELLNAPEKLRWESFRDVLKPIMQEALAVLDYLRKDVRLAAELVEMAEFDRFGSVVLEAVNSKVNYKEDTQRAILFSIAAAKQLLALPVSADLRRKLEANQRSDSKMLYHDFALPAEVDVGECWFLPGEPADPTAAILLPVYKITKLTASQIGWNTVPVAVPRSLLAQQVHQGKQKEAALANRQTSPTAQRLRSELEQAQGERDRKVKELQQQGGEHVSKIEQQAAAELKAQSAEAASAEKKVRAQLASVESQLQEGTAAATERFRTATAAVEARFAKALAGAESQLAAQKQRYAGWHGLARLEVPLVLGAAVLALVCRWLIGHSSGEELSVQGLASFAGGLGIAGGGATGWGVRSARTRKGRRALGAVEGQQAAESAKVRAACDLETAGVKAKAAKEKAAWEAQLKEISAKHVALEKKWKDAVAKAKESTQAAVKRVIDEAGQRIGALEQKLGATVQFRKESAKSDFPIYKAAKKDGYKDGERPVQSEAQALMSAKLQEFMNSLTDTEKRSLALMFQALPAEKAMEIIEVLSGLSPSERRRKLGGLF